jgi:hypothetical protein
MPIVYCSKLWIAFEKSFGSNPVHGTGARQADECIVGGMSRPAATGLASVVEHLRSTRLAILASAISGMWLMLWLGIELEPPHRRPDAVDAWGLGWTLLITAGIAIGLAAMGIGLNDVLDRRHDRAFDPQATDRPIASGVVSASLAVVLVSVAGGIAIGLSCLLGLASVAVTVAVVGAIVFYNSLGRYLPAVGVISLGLIFSLGMAIPNPRASFAWPVLLAMSHIVFCGTLRLGMDRRGPAPGPLTVAGIMLGWAFWSLIVLLLIRGRGGWDIAGSATAWIAPSLTALAFVCYALWTLKTASQARRLDRQRFRKLSYAWLLLYDTAWLASVALVLPAVAHLVLFSAVLVMRPTQSVETDP